MLFLEIECSFSDPVEQIIKSWATILSNAQDGGGKIVSAAAEHAAASLWRFTATLPDSSVAIARALSASAVFASELDRHAHAAASMRSAALGALDALAMLLRQAPPNAFAEAA
jgi:ABC-type transporter Mla subunit MlaD